MNKIFASTCCVVALAGLSAPQEAAARYAAPGFERFQYCPYDDPDVGTCVISTTRSGVFSMGTSTIPITEPIVLQGGIVTIAPSPLFDAVGAPTLDAPPGKVPGGLLGIANPAPNWPGPLWVLFWTIVNTVNDVYAKMELVDTVQTDFGKALNPPSDGTDPTAVRIAVRVKLDNPFLGDSCYIGSAEEPIVLQLQTGTTNPPAPNLPISGDPGQAGFVQVGDDPYAYILDEGSILVDNAFAVPAAHGCGNVALGLPIVTEVLDLLVSGAVNLKVGLPSAAGKNTAILAGDTALAASSYVRGGGE